MTARLATLPAPGGLGWLAPERPRARQQIEMSFLK